MKTMITNNRLLKNLSPVTCHLSLGAVLLSLCVSLASCSDWNDHYEGGAGSTGGDETLWEQLSGNAQLSDFSELLAQTMVFRMHKKTPVSYAQLLNGGQAFTVVAPLNGPFNRDSLLSLLDTNQGDSVVEKFFVMNHLSRTTSSVTAQAQDLLMLNGKHMATTLQDIEGTTLVDPNRHAENGVIHVAATPLPYFENLYEKLCDDPEYAAIGTFLRQYDEDEFNPTASVSNGIVEGVPVYVDSVVDERNRMLETIGLINAEDSAYWVVVPSKTGWEDARSEALTYFVYDQKVLKRDSIQNYWVTRALLDDAIFNTTLQDSPQDSLVSVQYSRKKPKWHVFYNPFAADGILAQAEEQKCSNGILYGTREWPFTPEMTYFTELWTEAEESTLLISDEGCTINTRSLLADSVSEGKYILIQPETYTTNWKVTFRVDNTLSGNYDVCAVVLPKSVNGSADTKQNKFKAWINYVDTLGNEQSYACKTADNKSEFKNNALCVDTIVLAEDFHFPACNYDQSNSKITVLLQCSMLPRDNTLYSREMLLDCIYLRPRRSVSAPTTE